jgi:hypothetical protein
VSRNDADSCFLWNESCDGLELFCNRNRVSSGIIQGNTLPQQKNTIHLSEDKDTSVSEF